MPGLHWCGRSWAVSADVIPVVAFLGLLFHLCWIVLVIILQFSLGSLQGCYATEDSRQHLGVLCLLFSSFVATALIELALIVTGLQGTPLEVKKRRAVPILLSIQLGVWISQLLIAGVILCFN
ncbi:g3212 [Coccomyxa viridis]|uniref:G3212 protein n=1 Tax=Coccomyxa viridis TaxID=1274662 RepID=A0ABP1FR94_9CHLO